MLVMFAVRTGAPPRMLGISAAEFYTRVEILRRFTQVVTNFILAADSAASHRDRGRVAGSEDGSVPRMDAESSQG